MHTTIINPAVVYTATGSRKFWSKGSPADSILFNPYARKSIPENILLKKRYVIYCHRSNT